MSPRRRKRPFKKRLFASPLFIWPIAILGAGLIRLLFHTTRVTIDIDAGALPYMRGEQPGVFCFWHGRMIMQPFMKPPRPMYVLSSRHADGKMISTVMHCLGIHTVYGSKNRDGARALRNLMHIAERRENITMTPDGPRGPFQQASIGTAFVASKTGYPLIPIAFSATRHWRIKSWDRFMLPKPFSRLHFVVGMPIPIASHATEAQLEATTTELQSSLNSVTARADQTCGVAL